MKKNIPYKNFSKYVLRTPLFSVNSYKNLTSSQKISNTALREYCNNSVFKEALFLASPTMYDELIKWLNGEKKDPKKEKKLKYTLIKYISRMSSRCTPFGLFAGCCVGEFGEEINLELRDTLFNNRHTRLDMNYLVALSKDLAKIKRIKKQLLYFPNSSIYKVGNQIRYVEYQYIQAKRLHHISSVDFTGYLEKIFNRASKGALIDDLANTIVNINISKKDADEFIEELIENQILISELEPSLTGLEFLNQIILTLKKINDVDEIVKILEETRNSLNEIDKKIGNSSEKYILISENLKKLKTKFELRYLFQTDLIINSKKNSLEKEMVKDILKGMSFLNKITLTQKDFLLNKFKNSFYERFEGRNISLSKALDVEFGLGYNQNNYNNDINPLVDDIILPYNKSNNYIEEKKWSSIDKYFHKKLIEALKNKDYIINLEEEDFKNYEIRWDDLPDTISFIVEKIKIKNSRKIKLKRGGGSSAANLLARFCYGDRKINSLTNEIIDIETQINKDKILAEIVHLPESRVGNVLMRPDFRKYEIPYLAKSTKILKNQLNLDDIFVSLKGQNEIILKSKKLNKEVIPRLTNAHNYSYNSLPIYHFLSDLQNQNKRNGIGFYLGSFSNEFEFIPRIEYCNIILHEATWNLQQAHISKLFKNKDHDFKLLNSLQELRINLQIPQFVLLVDGDNELLINLENITSIQMFLDTVKGRTKFKLTEFLYEDDGVVKKGEEYFTNQVIVSFYNDEKLKKNCDK